MPAQATRASMRPQAARTRSTIAWTGARSATFVGIANARRPSASIAAAVAAAVSGFRSTAAHAAADVQQPVDRPVVAAVEQVGGDGRAERRRDAVAHGEQRGEEEQQRRRTTAAGEADEQHLGDDATAQADGEHLLAAEVIR